MRVYESKKGNKDSFPIILELNDGKHYFTDRAAIELRDRLDAIIKARQGGVKA